MLLHSWVHTHRAVSCCTAVALRQRGKSVESVQEREGGGHMQGLFDRSSFLYRGLMSPNQVALMLTRLKRDPNYTLNPSVSVRLRRDVSIQDSRVYSNTLIHTLIHNRYTIQSRHVSQVPKVLGLMSVTVQRRDRCASAASRCCCICISSTVPRRHRTHLTRHVPNQVPQVTFTQSSWSHSDQERECGVNVGANVCVFGC